MLNFNEILAIFLNGANLVKPMGKPIHMRVLCILLCFPQATADGLCQVSLYLLTSTSSLHVLNILRRNKLEHTQLWPKIDNTWRESLTLRHCTMYTVGIEWLEGQLSLCTQSETFCCTTFTIANTVQDGTPLAPSSCTSRCERCTVDDTRQKTRQSTRVSYCLVLLLYCSSC